MSIASPTAPLLTVREVSDRLSLSTRTVWRLIDDGSLPAIAVSERAVRVTPADLETYLESRRKGS